MLTAICEELNNWFDKKKYFGTFSIVDGELVNVVIPEGGYYRIVGSFFNDGVHLSEELLQDETFEGAVWKMAVPPEVVKLAKDIEKWLGEYGEVTLSPYRSESFGGYSYTRDAESWQDAFRQRLNVWRKL